MLQKYYSFIECNDVPTVLRRLNTLEKDGFISFKHNKETDSLEIEDLDLSDNELESLIKLFEDMNVLIDSDGKTDDEYYKDDSDDNDSYNDFHSHY